MCLQLIYECYNKIKKRFIYNKGSDIMLILGAVTSIVSIFVLTVGG